MATLAGAFGLLALTLACVGLYGLLAYSVAQRTKEIGIRMALGAQESRVVALVLKGGARLVLIGIALGLPAAWAASRWVESMLFGLTPTDPVADWRSDRVADDRRTDCRIPARPAGVARRSAGGAAARMSD